MTLEQMTGWAFPRKPSASEPFASSGQATLPAPACMGERWGRGELSPPASPIFRDGMGYCLGTISVEQ